MLKASLLVVALVLGVSAEASWAQEPELVFKPGDTVRVVVAFKTPIALDGGGFFFYLQGDPQEPQRTFATEFGGSQFAKISDNEYEIAGTVREEFASGRWQLRIIDVAAGGVRRRYNFGTDFKSELTIRIGNPKHVRFPEIKDVTLKPPRGQ